MRSVKGIAFLALTTGLAACSNYPLPVKEPRIEVAQTWADIVVNLKKYRDSYANQHSRLVTHEYRSSDGSILGGVIGVVGGLASSGATAAAGAGIASSSSLYGQRYAFRAQANNYYRASKVMHCMYRVASVYSLDGDKQALDKLNEQIDEVRYALYDAQSSVSLVNIDPEEISKAFRAEEKAMEDLAKAKGESLVESATKVYVLAYVDRCVKSF